MREQKSLWLRGIRFREYASAGAVSGGLVLEIALLFYSDLRAIIPIIPFGVIYYRRCMEKIIRRKQQEFERQFQDALQSLGAQLHIGYSMENAVKEVQKDIQMMYKPNTVIVREFTYMVRQLNLNVTAEQAWKDFADRVALPEVESFATVFVLSKRSGGDSIAIIQNAVKQIGERAEVKREIETVIAAKKLEFQVMAVIPFGIIGYMRLSFPEFMEVLYGNGLGICFMSGCLGLYFAAWKFGCRIVEIEV